MSNTTRTQLDLKKLIVATVALIISLFMFGAMFFSGPQQLANTSSEKQVNFWWWSSAPRWIWR